MKISPAQVKLFWNLWSKVCKTQGWTKDRGFDAAAVDAKRKEVLRSIGFASLTLVDKTHGFGKVKATLERLGDKVQGAIEEDHPELDVARRMRAKITGELIPLLGVYRADPWAIVQSIIDDKFENRGYTVRELENLGIEIEVRIRTLKNGKEELYESPCELEQLLMTVTRYLHHARRDAGHSGHENYELAQLTHLCGCKRICKGFRRSIQTAPAEPVLAGGASSETDPF